MIEVNKRNIRQWSLLGPSGTFGIAAIELAKADPKVLMLTADLCFFSGLERFKTFYPDRLYNFGIAEQNMLGAAGGMAKEGFIPFVTTYASFCTSRCVDQVRVNMAYMKLPIKLIGLTAGYGAGVLGATHVSIEDCALMRALPNITVLSPADGTEIIKAVIAAAATPDPTYIRLTGPTNSQIVYRDDYDFKIGKAVSLRKGTEVCFFATGSVVYQTMQAAEMLQNNGVSCSVLNFHTIKPIDQEAIREANENHKLIVSVEEHNIMGGLFGAVAEILSQENAHRPILPIGIPDVFVSAGSYDYQIQESGLNAKAIYSKVLCRLQSIL